MREQEKGIAGKYTEFSTDDDFFECPACEKRISVGDIGSELPGGCDNCEDDDENDIGCPNCGEEIILWLKEVTYYYQATVWETPVVEEGTV